jgi:WD40 repeat protein
MRRYSPDLSLVLVSLALTSLSSLVLLRGKVTSAALSSDDHYLLTSSRFSPSRLIDLRTGNVVTKYTMKGHSGSTNWFYRSSFSVHDQCVVGGASMGVTSLWSTQTGQLLYTLQLPSPPSSSGGTSSHSNTSSVTRSYLRPTVAAIPLSPSFIASDLFSASSCGQKIASQYQRSEIIQCYSERHSGIVASLTDSSIVLWK